MIIFTHLSNYATSLFTKTTMTTLLFYYLHFCTAAKNYQSISSEFRITCHDSGPLKYCRY